MSAVRSKSAKVGKISPKARKALPELSEAKITKIAASLPSVQTPAWYARSTVHGLTSNMCVASVPNMVNKLEAARVALEDVTTGIEVAADVFIEAVLKDLESMEEQLLRAREHLDKVLAEEAKRRDETIQKSVRAEMSAA